MLADDGNGLISFTPITTVLAGGSVIVFPVGFCIAISVIGFPGLEFTSTWYMHNLPGLDNGFTNSS